MVDTLNDALKTWLHTVTGTTPGSGLTINDMLQRINDGAAIIQAGELRLSNSTTGNVRRMYLDDDDAIADEAVP